MTSPSDPPPATSPSSPCSAVAAALARAETCLLLTHENPDGDGIGSVLALRLGLLHLKKVVDCAAPHPCPAKYRFLPGAETIETAAGLQPHDCAVALDCDGKARLGHLAAGLRNATMTVNMDHHPGERAFADINWVDAGKAAAGLMVAELLGELGVAITRDIATCLYCAVATDTGFFRFENTSVEALAVAAELVKAGADPSDIARRAADQMPIEKAMLMGRALASLQTWNGGEVIAATLARDDFSETGALPEHTDGIIDELKRIEKAEVMILLREQEPGAWRVSLRSVEADVAGICRRAGGGGHRLAAGCELRGSAQEVAERMVEEAIASLEATAG